MTFISYEFLAFTAVTIAAYFIFPLKIRYLVLLAASLFFYYTSGWQKMFFLAAACLITYVCGLGIGALRGAGREDASQKDRKGAARAVLVIGLFILLNMLIYAKVGNQLLQMFADIWQSRGITPQVIVPLGISYYTLAAIGYLADVYWKKDKVEKNPLKLLLYLCFFPQILQGPIPKHRRLKPMLDEGHRFNYNRMCFGLQRALWGYFKKLVIADRLSLMVTQVFDNYLNYSGFVLLFALAGAVFQLYADFSGCVDIALGISEVFGITLEENFRRPFYSTSAAEFWRRWHISLGSWFKDYVYMPLSTAPWLMKLGRYCKDHFGRTTARNVMTTIPLLVVWLLTGLWHGTGWDYLVWGLYWGGIITLSTWLRPVYKKLDQRFGLDPEAGWWQKVCQIRTFGIYMVGRLLTIPGNLLTSRWIGRKILTWNPETLFDGTLLRTGWNEKDAWAAVIALLILWRVSSLQEKGVHIRETVSGWPLPIRWAFYYGAVFAVLIFGMYGNGTSISTFVYMNF